MAERRTRDRLLVGVGEVDITPRVGTAMAGSLSPRTSLGVQDPLMAKAVVIESGGRKMAYVIVDVVALFRDTGDAAVRLAAKQSGIPAECIVWAASHTHTGPVTLEHVGFEKSMDRRWLGTVPAKMAQAVRMAAESRQAARMSHCRGYQLFLSHNRRLMYKDGRAVNTWNLPRSPSDVQCVGSAGPVDPEVGVVAFDDMAGRPIAVMFQYTLHANTNFSRYFSGDYPAVVAARLRERFGPQVVTLYVPGACGDLNASGRSYREVGDSLAAEIIARMEGRKQAAAPVAVGVVKREVTVPYRDLSADQERRIQQSGWDKEVCEFFRKELRAMRREGVSEARAILQAWRIGDVGFASVPGELFVEWGLKIKRESVFPWTYPVELGGDCLGYLITQAAMEAVGYEGLIFRASMIAPRGVEVMVNEVLAMLAELRGSDLGGRARAGGRGRREGDGKAGG